MGRGCGRVSAPVRAAQPGTAVSCGHGQHPCRGWAGGAEPSTPRASRKSHWEADAGGTGRSEQRPPPRDLQVLRTSVATPPGQPARTPSPQGAWAPGKAGGSGHTDVTAPGAWSPAGFPRPQGQYCARRGRPRPRWGVQASVCRHRPARSRLSQLRPRGSLLNKVNCVFD